MAAPKKGGGRRSRNKGSKWERDVAHMLEEIFKTDVKRGIGQARAAGEVADVTNVPGFWVEAKHWQRTNPQKALAQAAEAQNDVRAPRGSKSKMPVAICKDNRQLPIAVMYLPDFLLILREWWEKQRRLFPEELYVQQEPQLAPSNLRRKLRSADTQAIATEGSQKEVVPTS